MTQTVEVDLGKILERIEENQKKFIETTTESLTKIQINQARLEGEVQNIKATLSGKIEVLQVEVQNFKENIRELKAEIKEARNDNKWVIGLIITLGVGLGTLLLKAFDFFPKA